MATVIAFDYGEKRVGVALADTEVKFASVLATLANDTELLSEIKKLITEHKAAKLVVGLPRNLAGDDTAQTARARKFAEQLESEAALPVYLIDEAATSIEAEARLKAGKKAYQPGDIDGLAAALILEDYLANYA